MHNNEVIAIVENELSWRDQFEKVIKAIDEKKTISKFDLKTFEDKFQTTNDFDGIDYFFVDLELGPGAEPNLEDMWGLERVLPRIRKLAPWIPVACISRYITGDPRIVGTLSESDFDALYPKAMISSGTQTDPDFNKDRWNSMLQGLRIKRIASLTGRPVDEIRILLANAGKNKVQLSDSVKEKVGKIQENLFVELISLLGLGGGQISVDEIDGGFSGIHVCKLGVYGSDDKGVIAAYWLIKWSDRIRKVAEEAEAHNRLFRRGIDRSLLIPQLYQNVTVWGGLGLIAYGFEKDATTALQFLRERNLQDIISYLEKIALNLYSNRSKKPISPRDELIKWCNIDDADMKYINQALLKNTKQITSALIHGDLHLRNIFICENGPTLIDFARSDSGPIAIDVAKLVIDILTFYVRDKIQKNNFTWIGLKESDLSGLMAVFEKYLTSDDDVVFYELALRSYALKYLSYPDVPDISKERIKELLFELKES